MKKVIKGRIKKKKKEKKLQRMRKLPMAKVPYRIQKLKRSDLIKAKRNILEQEGPFFTH